MKPGDRRRRIGLLGGTFDPIHYGHLMIAEEARTLADLDEVIFIPAGQNPFKEAQKPEEREHCFQMLSLAVEDNPAFRISRVEMDKPGKSYTVDTVEELKTEPDADYYFILGSDLLDQIDTWRQADKLLHEVGLIVVRRPYSLRREPRERVRELHKRFGTEIRCIDAPMMGVSSTKLREMTRSGQSIRYYTPDSVIRYIQGHNLYMPDTEKTEKKSYDSEKIKLQLSGKLKSGRYKHTLGVVGTAKKLAKRWGADPEKAETAALLHDCAKGMNLKEMQQAAVQAKLDADPEVFESAALLHAPVGAWIASTEYGVTDPEILSAIASHTIGGTAMSTLDKIIFLADYIEPGRDTPGVEKIRRDAKKDLNQAVLEAMSGTISYLAASGARIYPKTVEARNALISEMKQNKDKSDSVQGKDSKQS